MTRKIKTYFATGGILLVAAAPIWFLALADEPSGERFVQWTYVFQLVCAIALFGWAVVMGITRPNLRPIAICAAVLGLVFGAQIFTEQASRDSSWWRALDIAARLAPVGMILLLGKLAREAGRPSPGTRADRPS